MVPFQNRPIVFQRDPKAVTALDPFLPTCFCSTGRTRGSTLHRMKHTNQRVRREQRNGGVASASTTSLRWARQLAADVQAVLLRHPEADPNDVRLTLICLQWPPLER